jgi:hypothetical protein
VELSVHQSQAVRHHHILDPHARVGSTSIPTLRSILVSLTTRLLRKGQRWRSFCPHSRTDHIGFNPCQDVRDSTTNNRHVLNKTHERGSDCRHSWLRGTKTQDRRSDRRSPCHAVGQSCRASPRARTDAPWAAEDERCRAEGDRGSTAEKMGRVQRRVRVYNAGDVNAQTKAECGR